MRGEKTFRQRECILDKLEPLMEEIRVCVRTWENSQTRKENTMAGVHVCLGTPAGGGGQAPGDGLNISWGGGRFFNSMRSCCHIPIFPLARTTRPRDELDNVFLKVMSGNIHLSRGGFEGTVAGGRGGGGRTQRARVSRRSVRGSVARGSVGARAVGPGEASGAPGLPRRRKGEGT